MTTDDMAVDVSLDLGVTMLRKNGTPEDLQKLWIGHLIRMVRPERFELPTFWFVAVASRRTNNLDGVGPVVTECYRCLI
jgi:hypothetical protein